MQSDQQHHDQHQQQAQVNTSSGNAVRKSVKIDDRPTILSPTPTPTPTPAHEGGAQLPHAGAISGHAAFSRAVQALSQSSESTNQSSSSSSGGLEDSGRGNFGIKTPELLSPSRHSASISQPDAGLIFASEPDAFRERLARQRMSQSVSQQSVSQGVSGGAEPSTSEGRMSIGDPGEAPFGSPLALRVNTADAPRGFDREVSQPSEGNVGGEPSFIPSPSGQAGALPRGNPPRKSWIPFAEFSTSLTSAPEQQQAPVFQPSISRAPSKTDEQQVKAAAEAQKDVPQDGRADAVSPTDSNMPMTPPSPPTQVPSPLPLAPSTPTYEPGQPQLPPPKRAHSLSQQIVAEIDFISIAEEGQQSSQQQSGGQQPLDPRSLSSASEAETHSSAPPLTTVASPLTEGSEFGGQPPVSSVPPQERSSPLTVGEAAALLRNYAGAPNQQ